MIGAFDLLKVLSVTSLARVLVARAGGFKGWDADRGLDGAAKWPSSMRRLQFQDLKAIAHVGQKPDGQAQFAIQLSQYIARQTPTPVAQRH